MANKTNDGNLEGLLKEVLKRIDSLQTEVDTSREIIQFNNQSAKDAGFTDVPTYFNSFLSTNSSRSVDKSVAEWAQTTLADYNKAMKTVEAAEKKIANIKKNFAKRLSDMKSEADENEDLIRQFVHEHQSDFDMLGLSNVSNIKSSSSKSKKTTRLRNATQLVSPQVQLGRRQQFVSSDASSYYKIDFDPTDAFNDLSDRRQAEYDIINEQLTTILADTRNLVGKAKTNRDEQIKDLTRKKKAIELWMKESDVYTTATISGSLDSDIFTPAFFPAKRRQSGKNVRRDTYTGAKTLSKYLDAYIVHKENTDVRQKIIDTLKTAVYEDVYGNYNMMLANQMHRYNKGEGFEDSDLKFEAQSMIQEVIAELPPALREYITLGREGLQDQNNVDTSTVSSANRAYQLSNPIHAKTGMELYSLINERNARYRNINAAKEVIRNTKSSYVKSLGLKFPTLKQYREDTSERKIRSKELFEWDNEKIFDDPDALRHITDLMQVTSRDLIRGRRDAEQLLETEDITAEERIMAEEFIKDSMEFSSMVKDLTAPLSGKAFSAMGNAKAQLEHLKKSNASPEQIKLAETRLQQAKTQYEAMYNWQNTLNRSLGITGGAEESMQILSAILTSPMITDYGVEKALSDRGITQKGPNAIKSYKQAAFSDDVLAADTVMHDIYNITQSILSKGGFGDLLPSDVKAIAEGRPVSSDMDPEAFIKNQKQLPELFKQVYDRIGSFFKGTKDDMGNFVFDKRIPGYFQVDQFMRALDTIIKSTDGNFDSNGRNALLEGLYSQHNTHGLTFNEETGEFINTILSDGENDPFAYYEPSKVRNQLGNKVGVGTSGNYAADNLSNKKNFVEYGTIPWANDKMIKDEGLTDDVKARKAIQGLTSPNKSIAKSFRSELESLWDGISDDTRSAIADDLLDSGKIMFKGKIKNASTREVLDGIINGTLDSVSMDAQERFLTNLEWESKQPSSKVLNQEGTLNFMLDDIRNKKLGYTKGLMHLRESDPEGFSLLAKMLYNSTPVAQLTTRSSSEVADIFKTVWSGDGAELTVEQSRLIDEYVNGTSRNKQFDRKTLEQMEQAKSVLEQRKAASKNINNQPVIETAISDVNQNDKIANDMANNIGNATNLVQDVDITNDIHAKAVESINKGMTERINRANKMAASGSKITRAGLTAYDSEAFDIYLNKDANNPYDESGGNSFQYTSKKISEQIKGSGDINQKAKQLVSDLSKLRGLMFDNWNSLTKEDDIDDAWSRWQTQDDLPIDQRGVYTRKSYGTFSNVGDINPKNIGDILNRLTDAGFKGQVKVPAFYDTATQSDQLVIHASDEQSFVAANSVLDQLRESGMLSNVAQGIDLNKGTSGTHKSFTQLLESIYNSSPGKQFSVDDIKNIIKNIGTSDLTDINEHTVKPIVDSYLGTNVDSVQTNDGSVTATSQDTDTSSVDKLISTEEQLIQATTNNTAAIQNNTQAEISSDANVTESPEVQPTKAPQAPSTVGIPSHISPATSQDLTLDKLPIVQSDNFANDHTYYDAATGEKVMSITQLRDLLLGKSNPTFARDLNYIKSAADALGDGEVLTADMVGSDLKNFNFLKGVIGSGLRGNLFHEAVDAIFNYNKANPNAMIKSIAELQGKDDDAYQKIMNKTSITKAQLAKYGFGDDYLTIDQAIASYMEAIDKLGLKPTGFSERPLGFQMMGPNGLFKVAATLDQLYSGEMGLPFTLDNKTGSVEGFESFQLTGQVLAMMANQADIPELSGMDFTKVKMGIADVKNGFTKILPYDALSPEAMYELIAKAYAIKEGKEQHLSQDEINSYNTQRKTGIVTGGILPTFVNNQEIKRAQKIAMQTSLKSQKNYDNAELNMLRAQKALEKARASGNAEAIYGAEQQLEGARQAAEIASQYRGQFALYGADGKQLKITDDKGKYLSDAEIRKQAGGEYKGAFSYYNQETGQMETKAMGYKEARDYLNEMTILQGKHMQAVGKTNAQVKTMGSLIGEVLGGLKQTIQYLMRTSIVYAMIGKVKQAFTTLIQTTQALNKSYVDLRIASGQTDSQMKDSLKIYNQMAKEMGKTTQEVAAAANDWLRAGYNAEESAKLIKNSMQLSTVGMIDSAKATEYLISTMKGWKLGVDDMEGVIDKMAELDRNEINNMVYRENGKSYPLNCWEILKLDKLQRNDEICVNVICDESRKNYQDDTRLKPKCYCNRCSAAKLRIEESSTINRLVSGVGMKANVILKRWASVRAMI